MKDEYIYCALNDCNINNGYSKCCLYCNDTDCLMAGLKELKEERDANNK